MIPYSLTKKPINANLIAINQAKNRIRAAQEAGVQPSAEDLALVNSEQSEYFAIAQVSKKMSIEDLAHHIANHQCPYSYADIQAIILRTIDCVKEQLLEGKKVSLGGLGDFQVRLISDGEADPGKFTSDNITDVKVVWTCGSELKNLRPEAEFKEVASRKAQAAALKAMKKGEGTIVL